MANAGTINRTVSLTGNDQDGGRQRYIAKDGAVLNGNLVLGLDAVLVTDLANTGTGQFASINGTVTAANGAALWLRVTGAQSALWARSGLSRTPPMLTSRATPSLTANGVVTRQVGLAGSGTVDITAELTTTNATGLATTFTLGNTAAPNASSGAARASSPAASTN